MPITGAIESKANNIDDIIKEVATTRTTEKEEEELMTKELKQPWRIEKNKGIFNE